jgi:hypothetical protein
MNTITWVVGKFDQVVEKAYRTVGMIARIGL